LLILSPWHFLKAQEDESFQKSFCKSRRKKYPFNIKKIIQLTLTPQLVESYNREENREYNGENKTLVF
jgi:hypothetical protein